MSTQVQHRSSRPSRANNSQAEIRRMVHNLNYHFREATMPISTATKAQKGTLLYDLQVEYSHMVHELQTGFTYKRHAMYGKIEQFISSIPDQITKS